MLITCNKCHKETEAYVTRSAPHKVVCEHCHGHIDNMSDFVVRNLVRSKKFAVEKKQAFSFYCAVDREQLPGVLDVTAAGVDIVRCSKCSTQMNVSKFMIDQFKEVSKIQ